MKIFAPAKLNICLDILRRTPSGFHEIRTVFVESCDLKDELEIIETDLPDKVSIPHPLALKALKLIKTEYSIKSHVRITIKQNIPFSSGLGGASSDAAAILKGLNKLWKLNLSASDLLALARNLGSDVPFFITGGTALGAHFGEELTPLPAITCVKFKILPRSSWPSLPKNINPDKKTAQMYASLDLKACGKNAKKTDLLIKAIKSADRETILNSIHNDFETLIPVPKNTHLSGSGPAVFSAN
ncbi:MAG: 4-(cytidine 5'-diphospho)-2-C-methyl-D-erythritol kinase [Candidatus Peregrinibacteria bacterium]